SELADQPARHRVRGHPVQGGQLPADLRRKLACLNMFRYRRPLRLPVPVTRAVLPRVLPGASRILIRPPPVGTPAIGTPVVRASRLGARWEAWSPVRPGGPGSRTLRP